MATDENKGLVTQVDIEQQQDIISSAENELSILNDKYELLLTEIKDGEVKVISVRSLKSQFPIDELTERYEAQQDLERTLVDITHSYEKEKILLKSQKKTLCSTPAGPADLPKTDCITVHILAQRRMY